jgi:hypothetical protein
MQVGMKLVEMSQWQDAKGICGKNGLVGWMNGQRVSWLFSVSSNIDM